MYAANRFVVCEQRACWRSCKHGLYLPRDASTLGDISNNRWCGCALHDVCLLKRNNDSTEPIICPYYCCDLYRWSGQSERGNAGKWYWRRQPPCQAWGTSGVRSGRRGACMRPRPLSLTHGSPPPACALERAGQARWNRCKTNYDDSSLSHVPLSRTGRTYVLHRL